MAGHFLSASAMMWASTHNDTLYQRMTSVVDALNSCQKKIGTGYLSAFPTELFDRVEALVYAWAPYYTIHKVGHLIDNLSLNFSSEMHIDITLPPHMWAIKLSFLLVFYYPLTFDSCHINRSWQAFWISILLLVIPKHYQWRFGWLTTLRIEWKMSY